MMQDIILSQNYSTYITTPELIKWNIVRDVVNTEGRSPCIYHIKNDIPLIRSCDFKLDSDKGLLTWNSAPSVSNVKQKSQRQKNRRNQRRRNQKLKKKATKTGTMAEKPPSSASNLKQSKRGACDEKVDAESDNHATEVNTAPNQHGHDGHNGQNDKIGEE